MCVYMNVCTYPEVFGSIKEENGEVDRLNDTSKGVNGDEEEAGVFLDKGVVYPKH